MADRRLCPIERPAQAVAGGVVGPRVLRPIEQIVLKSLHAGAGYAEIAARLRRSPTYVARIERFANLRIEMDVA